MPDTVDKISLLNAIPVRSEQVKAEWKGEYVVLAFPRFKKEWMRRFWLFKGLSQDIHVTLEEHGTAVWQLINGQRTVNEIVELLAVHFSNEADYASRVATYIMQLHKDGFIRLCLPSASHPL